MKNSFCKLAALALLLSTIIYQPSTVFAQGPLTPPGAPAPTFKTLDQVEPRTPISTVPFTITNSGSFYLTKSLATTTDGVIINSDDVTLDLNGFTLSGDGGSSDSGVEVGTSLTDGQQRVVIRNGIVRNFGVGVNIEPVSSAVVVEGIMADSSRVGIVLSGTATAVAHNCIIRNCLVVSNSIAGVQLGGSSVNQFGRSIISDCQVIGNAGAGFQIAGTNNLIIRNLASGNGTDYSISANNRAGIIVTPTATSATIFTGGSGSGTTDPFANLKY